MVILITGGCGFLGRRIALRLASRGDKIIAFDTVTDPALAETPNISVIEGDITAMSHVVEVFKGTAPAAVIHCAAIVGVVYSIKSPAQVIEVNLQGSLNLFEAMRLFDVRRMVHISSNEVYGDFRTPAAAEDHPLAPLMPYGISKVAVEQFGRTYAALHRLECINLRGSWIYAPDLPRPRLPNLMVDRVLRGEAVHMPNGGNSVMDYVHAEDFVDAVVAALDRKDHHYDAYNVGSGEGTTLYDLAKTIKRLLPHAELSVGPGRYEFQPGLPMRIQGALDISRARQELGFAPKYDIMRGIEELIETGPLVS